MLALFEFAYVILCKVGTFNYMSILKKYVI